MWWTLFTVVDLYIGLIVLDAMAPAVPEEKRGRLQAARKTTIGLLVVSGTFLIAQVARRYGWIRF